MAEVTLSKYCDEAKELIRSESYDQAIAICRHILKHYPKYLKAYRLLGEACLEKEDYVEAANFFKRVLGADVEDIVVYVGLGIIFDQQSALGEAVWQLERAFDLGPGNAEIRGELQRLYGERDGVPPSKLKLTSAALGRLYLREELYERAIDEFRNVLEEDPERPDIQIALAQALWWSDQRQEAARVCEEMLETYPNCLKANLILGEILLSSDREEEGKSLLDRARAMDPENVVAQTLFHEESPLSPETATVPRLDDASLAKEVEDLRPEIPLPSGGPTPGGEAPPSRIREDEEEAMPDWLRSLQEEEREFAGEESTSPVEPHVMPEWLQQLAQERAAEGVEAQEPGLSETRAEEEMIRRAETGEEIPSTPEAPAWLTELSEGPAPAEEKTPTAGPYEDEMPESLGDIRAEEMQDELAPELEEDVPAWLRDLTAEAAEVRAGIEEVETAAKEDVSPQAEVGEAPEPETHVAEAVPPPEVGVEEAHAPIEEAPRISDETMEHLRATMPDESDSIEEIMAWMEESKALLADEGTPETAIAEQIYALSRESEDIGEDEEIPTWLRQVSPTSDMGEEKLRSEEVEEPFQEKAVPTPEEEIPTWLLELRPESTEAQASAITDETEGAPATELDAQPEVEPLPLGKTEARAEAEPTSPAEEEVPTWLLRLRAEEVEEEPGPSEEPRIIPEAAAAPPSEEQMPSWPDQLREEAVQEGAIPSDEVEGREEELPAWLRELRAEAMRDDLAPPAEEPEPAVEEVAPSPSEEQEMPPWLGPLQAEEVGDEISLSPEEELPADVEPEPVEVEAEFPPWLEEVRAEVAGEGIHIPPEEIAASPEPESIAPTEAEEDLEREEAKIAAEVPPTPLEEEEVPSWLRELRTQAAEGDTALLMRATESAAEDVPIPPPDEEELPSWLRQLRAEAREREGVVTSEEEPVPLAEAMPAEEPAPVPEEEVEAPTGPYAPPPTPSEELIPPAAVTEPEEPLTIPPREEAVGETPRPEWDVEDYIRHLEANPRDHAARLDLARAYSAEGNLDQAARHYELMLSYGSMVQGVKEDLESMAERSPDHLPTHELLADAYMRSGELQKALSKYRWLRDMLAH